ncbi:TPA: hypothetical protein ACSVR2_003827 [Clostridioides difficile]|uniref:HTH merR-type domain-containing protein n=1 Tax=Clostridioides difficile TaxID=1496 RepID=A0A069AGZ7_CLODI|nr:merR HTH regulatory family protein [Clostridioides difficile]EQH21935.1 merR HTH regulatory family protein [Clostridioides difficile DA00212]EQK05063.1 merR HTH regulatory family protein [Clostridioides difficile P59]MCR1361762.1 hypothetical protein [Clostridioides difficile]MCR1430595.1 hypothetical protein [Clostridioides difficile]MCR8794788.1 hypothetical protein [Clostridioides difficile]
MKTVKWIAKLTKVSVHILHYYDEIGLLKQNILIVKLLHLYMQYV